MSNWEKKKKPKRTVKHHKSKLGENQDRTSERRDIKYARTPNEPKYERIES